MISFYMSPLGKMVMMGDELGLTGLYFIDQSTCPCLSNEKEGEPAVFEETKKWLDCYFSGKIPGFTPALHLTGTKFQLSVWNILLRIPYGVTTTYGCIARQISGCKGMKRMSSLAVGQAIKRNPVIIISACHRVIGAHGNLTGYAAGLERKEKLLVFEQSNLKIN